MALPSSGAILLSQIMEEFGGFTQPTNLRAYFKGQGYVFAEDTAPGVPSDTSGVIKITDFRGAARYVSSLVVTANTYSISGWGTDEYDPWVYTNVVTASASGGVAPYTYEWYFQLGGGYEFTNQFGAATALYGMAPDPVPEGIMAAGRIHCNVLDARGAMGQLNAYVAFSIGHAGLA